MMSILVLLWPEAATVTADDADGAERPAETVAYVLSSDGVAIAQQGRATLAQLPRADTIVAVLPARALSWHRVAVPKAPAGRLRAALGGVLEEYLLEDDPDTHLALAPGARSGADKAWVAAMRRSALAGPLAAWAAAGIDVDRVVAEVAPGGEPSAHVHAVDRADGEPELWITLADGEGACVLPLDGSLARARLAEMQARAGSARRVTATPAAASAAERWLGQPVTVLSDPERALAAARTGWDLRQFDLAPRLRGTRTLARLAHRLAGAQWRWARYGLVAAVALQLLGLNVYAWHQQRAIDQRKQAMVELLKASFPQVRAILDAPTQMQRETERLRVTAGVPGDTDLETLIAVAARAWPPGLAPTTSLRYEAGRLTVAAGGWQPGQVAQFRDRLRESGWLVDFADGQLVISKADAAATAALAPKGRS
jgi:general secretion pathway protein L